MENADQSISRGSEHTVLYEAVVQGSIDDVRSSLANKVFSWDLTDNDEDDYSFRCSLKKAIELDYQNIVIALLQANFGDKKYCFGNWKPRYVAEALEMAARLGRQEIVRQLLETEKDNIRTISNALAHGVWSGNFCILKMLINAGASPNCETEDWGTPLIAAVRTGNLQVVQFLVEAGADPNKWVDMDGYESPLSTAAHEGDERIFEYLLPLVTDGEEVKFARKDLMRRVTDRKRQNTN